MILFTCGKLNILFGLFLRAKDTLSACLSVSLCLSLLSLLSPVSPPSSPVPSSSLILPPYPVTFVTSVTSLTSPSHIPLALHIFVATQSFLSVYLHPLGSILSYLARLSFKFEIYLARFPTFHQDSPTALARLKLLTNSIKTKDSCVDFGRSLSESHATFTQNTLQEFEHKIASQDPLICMALCLK